VTRLGRQDGDPLVVDLRMQRVESWDQLWDALADRCGLPGWFGRNLDAWNDTLHGGISELLDEHPLLILRVQPAGIFAPGNPDGIAFREVTDDSGVARVEVGEP
jgi:hypothetical protein